jgi:hypothetical protein
MLRNRSLRVKMVKDDEPNEDAIPIDYHDVAKVVTKSVSTCICVYIAADIVRRAVIYTLTSKF